MHGPCQLADLLCSSCAACVGLRKATYMAATVSSYLFRSW